ncbi:MAG: TolC family protein, partial [Fulvivirga sp.]|nr:TolC family protein [Fulvivirga sp.]
MKYIFRLSLFLGFFLISNIGQAQDKKVWTLQECIDYAIKNNINVKRSDLSIVQNRSALNQSYADLAPSINARATHAYNFGQNEDPTTGIISDFESRTNTFGLSASVTLFNGFANYNTIKQNSFLVEASVAELIQAKNDIGLNVAQAYLQIIFNIELLEAAQLQLKSSKEQARRTKVMVENGAMPIVEKYQAEAQVATNETQVINRKNDLNLSKLQLMQLLQLPYDPAFDIEIPELEPDNIQPVVKDSDALFEEALTTQPIVEAAALRIEASEMGLAAAKGGRLPTLSAFAGVDTRYNNFIPIEFSDQIDNNLGQNIGFNLNVPIFNNFRVRQSIQVAKINKERAKLNQVETKNNLRQEVEQAYLSAQAAL